MKKKLIIIVFISLFILTGFITYHKDWYTYKDGNTIYKYYIYGINFKTSNK